MAARPAVVSERGGGGRCPLCGKPRVARFRPFCSRTCRDRDFLHWLDGRYAVPAVEVDEDGAEERRRDE